MAKMRVTADKVKTQWKLYRYKMWTQSMVYRRYG